MFAEILFLVIIFLVAAATKSVIFYAVLIVAFFLCLPGIIALNSAPYVPTMRKNAETMLKLADIKPGMKIYDLGAGDGRLVERAAKKGANAIGYEISFALVVFFWIKKAFFIILSRHFRPLLSAPHFEIVRGSSPRPSSLPASPNRGEQLGGRQESLQRINSGENPGIRHQINGNDINKRATIKGSSKVYWGNIWRKDITDADAVLCFLMPRAMARFEHEKFGTMKKGARLVSNIFPLPNTKPDKKENNVYLYIKK